MGMAFSKFCRNYRGHSYSNSALFEDESGALAEEAEVGVENGFDDILMKKVTACLHSLIAS